MFTMKAIERIKDGYKVTYVTGEGQETTQSYSLDQLGAMESLLKQARIHGSNEPALLKEDPVEEDINKKVEKIRLELKEEMKQQLERIESDYKSLNDTVSNSIATKNTLWTQIHDETEKRLSILSKTLQETRILEEKSLKVVLDGERRRNEAVSELKGKQNLSWEDTKKSNDDVKNQLKELESFKDQLNGTVKELVVQKNELINKSIEDIKTTKNKTETELAENKKVVETFISANNERIQKRNELLKETKELELKKAFIKKQVKLKQENDMKKKDHIAKLISTESEKLNNEISKIKKERDKTNNKIQLETAKSEEEKKRLLKQLEQEKEEAIMMAEKLKLHEEEEKELEHKEQAERVQKAVKRINKLYSNWEKKEQAKLIKKEEKSVLITLKNKLDMIKNKVQGQASDSENPEEQTK